MTIAPPSRYDAAVERELRRRKRLTLVYMAALLVPLVAGGIAVTRSRSERQLYTESLVPAVKEQVASEVPKAVGDAVQPVVARAVAESVPRQIEELVTPRLLEVDQLRAQVADLPAIRDQVRQVEQVNRRMLALDQSVRSADPQGLRRQMESIQQTQRRLDEAIGTLLQRLDNLEGRVKRLER